MDKKTPAIDLVDAVVDWQDDDEVVVEEEAHNSDDEAKEFAIDLPEEAESQRLESENGDGHDHNKTRSKQKKGATGAAMEGAHAGNH